MHITYYFEFYIQSLIEFWHRTNNKTLTLPEHMREKKLFFKSLESQQNYNICIEDLLNNLKIPHDYSESEKACDEDIVSNFLQEHIINTNVNESNICLLKDNIQDNITNKYKMHPMSFINVEWKECHGIKYMISGEIPNKQYIVIFNAYHVDFGIWKILNANLCKNFNVIFLDGNYGNLKCSADGINKVLIKEGIKKAVAVTWCSGFRVFSNFHKHYPNYFKKVISLTGNYNHINGEGKLSGFEQTLLAISKLIDDSNNYQLNKIFSHFFSKQTNSFFGIPEEVYPLISKQFTHNEYLKQYLKTVDELYKYDLGYSLEKLDIPMVNIIASNDSISSFGNNCLVDSLVDNCSNIMLNFATHWCLWTHATQIAEIIFRQMEGL